MMEKEKAKETKETRQAQNPTMAIEAGGAIFHIQYADKDGHRYLSHDGLVELARDAFMSCEFPQQTYADGKIVTICIVTNDLGSRCYGVGTGADGQTAANQAFDRAMISVLKAKDEKNADISLLALNIKGQYEYESKKASAADSEALKKAEAENKALQDKVASMEQAKRDSDALLKDADVKVKEAQEMAKTAEAKQAELSKQCEEQGVKLAEAVKAAKEADERANAEKTKQEQTIQAEIEAKTAMQERLTEAENNLKAAVEQKEEADRKAQEAADARKEAEDALAAYQATAETDGNAIRQEREAKDKAEAEKAALEQICEANKAELEQAKTQAAETAKQLDQATGEIAALKEANAASEAALKEAVEGKTHAEAALEALKSETFEAKRKADMAMAEEAKRRAEAEEKAKGEALMAETAAQEENVSEPTVEDIPESPAEEPAMEPETGEETENSEEEASDVPSVTPAEEKAESEPLTDSETNAAEETVTSATPEAAAAPVSAPATPTRPEPDRSSVYWFEHEPDWETPQSLTPENPDDVLLQERPFDPKRKASDQEPAETRMMRPGPKYISQVLKYNPVHIRSIIRYVEAGPMSHLAGLCIAYLKSQHYMLDCSGDPVAASVLDSYGVPHK